MEPRFPDTDAGAVAAYVAELSEKLTLYPEIDDPRNFEPFYERAHAKYAVGLAMRDVVNDLRCAAICLRTVARIRFTKLEVHRLKTRRLDPMHLSLLHASPELVEHMGSQYGLDLMTFYAGTATPDVEAEVHVFSPYFRTRRLSGPKDVPGLAALTYAAALGSLMAGDEASAGGVLRILGEAVDSLEQAPSEAGKRYLLQCAALADIHGRRAGELMQHLVALVPHARQVELEARAASPTAARRQGAGAPDFVIPALTGLATLLNVEVDIEALEAADRRQAALCREVLGAWERVE